MEFNQNQPGWYPSFFQFSSEELCWAKLFISLIKDQIWDYHLDRADDETIILGDIIPVKISCALFHCYPKKNSEEIGENRSLGGRWPCKRDWNWSVVSLDYFGSSWPDFFLNPSLLPSWYLSSPFPSPTPTFFSLRLLLPLLGFDEIPLPQSHFLLPPQALKPVVRGLGCAPVPQAISAFK